MSIQCCSFVMMSITEVVFYLNLVFFQVTILMEILCNSVPDSNARLPVLMSSFIARAASLFVHTG